MASEANSWKGKNEKRKKTQATSVEEARKRLHQDFLLTAPSGITYKIDMLNQTAYARLMSKMEGSDQASVGQFIMRNLVTLGKDILPEIVLKPKIGSEDGLMVEEIPPSDINMIVGAFVAGPSAITGMTLADEESFRDE